LIEASLQARGPYSLRLSTRHGSDATRAAARRVLRAVYDVDGRLEIAEARQLADGGLVVRAPSEEAIERVRFSLGLDDDHSEFVRRFSRDPLLGATVRRLKGLRPLRCATVTQALLRALCGQLITARRAREIERRVCVL
jgi:3-methyladenine DNA glycosylase/8-oxoguanine DNA glycosylase